MERINTITLERTLPVVFAGAENEDPVAKSQVWMQQLELRRPYHYMVEAESGTGKSSLCAFVYGSRRDYRGRILFNSTDVRSFSISDWCEIRRRHLAYLPQEMRLFPELTALENIEIKNRLTHTLSRNRIMELLDMLGIANKADSPAGRMSVGQQQRVAIIRAIAQPFDFLLLDEPVSHLDERNNVTVANLVAQVAAENAASIITTSVGNPLLLQGVETIDTVKSIKL